MIHSLRRKRIQRRFLGWLVLLGIPFFLIAACSEPGGLRPIAPTIVSNQIIAGQPQLVTFTELEADPVAYQDKLIRVTGVYVSLPVVSCSPYSGPNSLWALVANDLRLDVLGFEGLLNQLAPESLDLTLDGILRRYDGPLGCGKRPPDGVLWYLEAQQIVQPNPLVQAGTGSSGVPSIIPPPFPTGTPPGVVETPEEEATTGPGTPTRTPSPTGTIIATASSTPTLDPNESPTPDSTDTVTRTPTRTTTPTPTQSIAPGSGTATPTPTPTRTPAPGPTSVPLPTATPGGYPGATNTPYP